MPVTETECLSLRPPIRASVIVPQSESGLGGKWNSSQCILLLRSSPDKRSKYMAQIKKEGLSKNFNYFCYSGY